MLEPIGPGKGASSTGGSLAMLAALRDGQSALRNLQKANGHIGAAGDGTDTARPVLGTTAAEPGRAAVLYTAIDGVYGDPKLTGPRPTFDKTLLEQMRTDALEGPRAAERGEIPAPEADTAEPEAQTDESPVVAKDSKTTVPAAYGDLRGLDQPKTAGTAMDITT